ncbi:hypothetical protein [Actinokineospora enzanensis]|nr:hypothetical protein [Actinokineospora enzanensis]
MNRDVELESVLAEMSVENLVPFADVSEDIVTEGFSAAPWTINCSA